MGHTGKHIIDPETGLCEICDKGAIEEVHHGGRPSQHVYYSNSDERLTHRSHHDEVPHTKDRYVHVVDDERTPRYVRKPLYPAPTVRPRRVIYEQPSEQPIVIRRKVVRRDRTPPEQVIIHRPPPHRLAPVYYVDQEGHMVPQENTPPPEHPRRYVVQTKQQPPPPPARTVRVVRRHAQTPPPPVSEAWHTGPRRQINSDTEVIERQQRTKRDDSHHRSISPPKVEMYYLDAYANRNHHTPTDSPVHMSHDINSPTPKVNHHGDRSRKPTKVEPLEQKHHKQPEPTVVKRVYKKLPPGKYEPPDDEYISNENLPRSTRTTEKNHPPTKRHRSTPPLANRNNRSPEPTKNPSVYYMRSTDEYE